jgi:HSP20 family protein
MAKMTKKPPRSMPAIEVEAINQMLTEGVAGPERGLGPEHIVHAPNLDMFSTKGDVVIEVELPGVRKDDIEVTLCKNVLSIKALKYECFEEDKVNYVCMERGFGKMARTIEIPFPVDSMRIKAVYKNGMLTIAIPRVQDKRSSVKKIEIESSE